MRGNEGLNNGGGCSCRALWPFLLQLAGPPECVPKDCFWFERLHPGTVPQISWTGSFEHCAGCHTIRAGAFQCSPVVVDDTCVKSKCPPMPECKSPSPHPMTTAFGSIGAGSNEWTRDLCPTGLMSTGVKSGMKITAASTMRGSAFLLMILSVPS